MRETVAGGKIDVKQLTVTAGSAPAPVPGEAGAAWVDLVNPTPEQDRELLARLGVDIPTREEMEEIESSSRAYEENGVAYLTALVVCHTDTDEPGTTPVSFVLTPTHLVAVRFADLSPFRAFVARCARQPKNAGSSAMAFAGLVEAIVDRTADVLERADAALAAVSAEVFRGKVAAAAADPGRPRRQPWDLDDLRAGGGQGERAVVAGRARQGAPLPRPGWRRPRLLGQRAREAPLPLHRPPGHGRPRVAATVGAAFLP